METKEIGRKKSEYLAHREEILSAAEKMFAERGFFSTTMSDIAREAEFGTGTLYNCFKSKEELYFALIEEKMEKINRLVKAEISQKTSARREDQKGAEAPVRILRKKSRFF
jgi:AcrR family transcriptional regulator